jgi:hypothetical protein
MLFSLIVAKLTLARLERLNNEVMLNQGNLQKKGRVVVRVECRDTYPQIGRLINPT